MINERDIHCINLNVSNRIKDETYEYDNEHKLEEILGIIQEFEAEKICYYNDPVGELANAVGLKTKLLADHRLSLSFAKKLFGLDRDGYEGRSDLVFAEHTKKSKLPELFDEADTVVLISPDFSVDELDKTEYDVDLRMYSAVVTKRIRGLRANDIIADEFQSEENE